MKRIVLLVLATISVSLTFAQENDSIIVLQSKASRLSGLIDMHDLVNEGFNCRTDEFKGHWAGVEFGVNGFSNADYGMYPEDRNGFLKNDLLRSNTLNLNVLQYSRVIQQIRSTIGLVTGLGLSLQSYHLNKNTTILVDESNKIYPETLFFDSNQKSKLGTVFLDVPLLLEFQIPVHHSANRFYVSTGLVGAKRLEAHTKIKYRKDGHREKLKSPGTYSIRDYKVSGTLRMGYRSVHLFANYDLVPLFDERKGPVLYPFSLGLRLISF